MSNDMSDETIVTPNILGAPGFDPMPILVDMAIDSDVTVLARVHSRAGGTAFEILEMQRCAQPAVDRLAADINKYVIPKIVSMGKSFFDEALEESRKPLPWKTFTFKPLPVIRRRPRQRSVNMRKHARIVRNRMGPSEKRTRATDRYRIRRLLESDDGIVLPDWKDLL